MTNELVILVYTPLLIINILLLFSAALKKDKLNVDKLYIMLCTALIGWLVFELLFYILRDAEAVEFVYSAKFMFAAYLPVLFFLLIVAFYHLEKKLRWARWVFLIFPTILAVVAVTSVCHELFRVNFQFITFDPITTISAEWGPFYIANLVASQVPLVGILVIFATQSKKLPKAYRVSSNLLLLSFVIYVCGFLVEVTRLAGPDALDFNLMSICVSSFIFYIAVSSSGRADYMNIWQRDIFDYLDESIFVLNKDGIIVDANIPAVKMLEGIVPAVKGISMDVLFNQAQQTGQVFFRDVTDDHGNMIGQDLVVKTGKYPIIYSMQRMAIPTEVGRGKGEYITFNDVTQNRLLIERLQGTAGIDQLTGLKNRFGYEQMLRQMDVPDNLPISVLFGDVNGLKAVNDTHGHGAGDLLLKKAAEILLTCFPQENIARIGGDEFVVLLPHCSEAQAQAAKEKVKAETDSVAGFP